jgi:hypothetical protein
LSVGFAQVVNIVQALVIAQVAKPALNVQVAEIVKIV